MEPNDAPSPLVDRSPDDDDAPSGAPSRSCPANRAFIEGGSCRYNAVRERDDGTPDRMICDGFKLQPRVPTFSDPGGAMDVEYVLSLLTEAGRELLRQIYAVGKTPTEVAHTSSPRERTVRYLFRRAIAAVETLANTTL